MGRKQTEETKRRISSSKKGCIPWNKGKTGVYSKETLENWSKNRKGRHFCPKMEFKKGHVPWSLGLTKETDSRLMQASEKMKGQKRGLGHKMTEDNKRKLIDANTGRVHSKESIEQARQKMLGHIPWNKGLTKETDDRVKQEAMSITETYRNGRKVPNTKGRGKGGIRKDLNQYFRSTWEANFARVLNYWGLNWKYEPKVFDLISATYRPDFQIFDDNESYFVEIFPSLDEKHKRKLALFSSQYSNEKIQIIDRTIYKDLTKKFSKIIKCWEK